MALEKLTGGLPDEAVLMERSSPDPQDTGPGGVYALLRNGLRFSIAVPGDAAGSSVYAAEIIRVGGWWIGQGIPLYAGGIFSAVTGILCWAWPGALAGRRHRRHSCRERRKSVFGLFSGMALTVFQQFLAWMGVCGVILALVGLVLILISRWMRVNPGG